MKSNPLTIAQDNKILLRKLQQESESLKKQRKINRDELATHKKTHQNLLHKQRNFYQQKIRDSEKVFKEKYSHFVNEYKKVMETLESRLACEVDHLISSHTKNMDLKRKQLADPFYHVAELHPTLEDRGEHYIISLPALEHEKDHFTLSGDKRTIRLSMARRFQDQTKNEKGDFQRTNRSETLSTEFQVPDIIDGRQITRKWENNRLSYKIAKA